MRNIAICSSSPSGVFPHVEVLDRIMLEGVPVACGLVHTQDPAFDPAAPENHDHVLVKIRAFSCNYRDKSLILREALQHGTPLSFYAVGSEFVGDVLETGATVTAFRPGDRVIGNGAWPVEHPGIRPGLPTNQGSKEIQAFHQAKLISIPAAMPDEIAAAFPVGAQTSYSMVRKLGLAPGNTVLVTAARSNTSLFAIHALQRYSARVYATTTSDQNADALQQMGLQALIRIDPHAYQLLANDHFKAIMDKTGGFDGVVDPFWDVHLDKVVDVMAYGGRYVTCGSYAQFHGLLGRKSAFKPALRKIMRTVMTNGLQIIGNCIGSTEDLQNALDDYAAGRLSVQIDSVFTGDAVGAFFDRTYNAPDRFGKVVYRYA